MKRYQERCYPLNASAYLFWYDYYLQALVDRKLLTIDESQKILAHRQILESSGRILASATS